MLFVIGFLCFIPGYLQSLEQRYEVDRLFKPFDVIGNLKKSTHGRLKLCKFGMILGLASALVYINSDQSVELDAKTVCKLALGLVLIAMFFVYGRGRELELSKISGWPHDRYSCLQNLTGSESRKILIAASKDFGKFFAVLCALYLLKSLNHLY